MTSVCPLRGGGGGGGVTGGCVEALGDTGEPVLLGVAGVFASFSFLLNTTMRSTAIETTSSDAARTA